MVAFAAVLFIILIVAYPLGTFMYSLWQLAGRPLAVRLGLVEQTRDDLIVRGWNAERGGRWEHALATYEEVLRLHQWDEETEARLAHLLRQRPELTNEAERAQRERLAALDPVRVLYHLAWKPSNRKLRLVAVACCRCACGPRADDRVRAKLDALETYADGPLPAPGALAIGSDIADGELEGGELDASGAWADLALRLAVWMPEAGAAEAVRLMVGTVVQDDQVRLIECVFGLRGHTRETAPYWLTPTVLALARQMYDSRDFSAMPILADALQDAGCDNEDILNHCRSHGPHVRGCWVADLVLGKE